MAAFKLNLSDLQFVLRQIKIAEANSTAHAGAGAIELTQIYVDAEGNTVAAGTPGAVLAIPDPHVPNGLRTVDGSYNNIIPGREQWGAADQPMPRLFDASYINDTDGDGIDFDGPGPGGDFVSGDYGVNGTDIVDADPRTISNLVVDMSLNNPAAIVAALTFAGSEDVLGDQGEISAAFLALKAARDADPLGDHSPLEQALDDVLEAKGVTVTDQSIDIPNVAPDEGLSAPFNAWMTFFGQFFDHGLDLITKGNNGTIYVPLAADDPLVTHGPDGVAGTGDEVPAQLQFMALTRATPVDGSQRNITTPFVDQNQTYTSHSSHQVFLREYQLVGGSPLATGRLLGGVDGGLATWGDVKAQARDILGLQLSDLDVLNVPLLRTDAYGEFIRDANGFPQVILGLGLDGIPNTGDDVVASGTADSPLVLAGIPGGYVRTNHAFLDDIAHNAAPGMFDSNGDHIPDTFKAADADTDVGSINAPQPAGTYDNELLERHFITGDGRGNENIGLTAVHHIFHSEHNRQVDQQRLTILQSGDVDFINEWLATDIGALPDGFAALSLPNQLAYANSLQWDGERVFQAARVATEMQYQHLVFEEFARKIQPLIDPFVFNSVTDINPAIFSEFANTVYRFGHSMLTENMPRLFVDADGLPDPLLNDNPANQLDLVGAFLNPLSFDAGGAVTHDEAAAAIVRGMTVERGNEIDEFVVNALRNNLLGLPLDLAAINIARGRDTGIPTLNEAREQLFAASNSSFLSPYHNWVDFASNLKNPASIVNFIAAYGMHETILNADTLAEKRDAAMALVFGVATGTATTVPADRMAFLNATGAWSSTETGFNLVDLWIGGLAEKKMPFGGMLGSTFNAIFELQLENLQDGDRFYYLTRTQGQNFLTSLEQNSFAKMIMANTNLADVGPDGMRGTPDDIILRHIGVDSFARYDFVLEVNKAHQAGDDPTGNDPFLEAMGLGKVIRDDPTTAIDESLADSSADQSGATGHYIRFTGGEHVVFGGTAGNDTIIADFGDDGIWGDAGDDRIEAGAGVDLVNGGAGNDIITDSGDTGDFLKGDEGDDVIANSNGIDILMGGDGKDAIFVGVDATEVFAGQGDDFVLGGDDVNFLIGNEGDDWLEGGGGFDTTAGDNSELFFNSAIKGHDVMFAGSEEHDFDAESGDDIMVQGESVIRNEGMFGFDWGIWKGLALGANADLRVPIFTTEQADILRNRFDKTEALSGWDQDDILRGDDRVFGDIAPGDTVGTTEGIFFADELTQAGVDRIENLRQLLGNLIAAAPGTGDLEAVTAFDRGNFLLGGGGSDLLQGNGGDDFIDGDSWLNVRIRITGDGQENSAANEIATVDTMKHIFSAGQVDSQGEAIPAEWIGKSLFELMVSRTIKPNQMHIVREIVEDDGVGDTDTALFNDVFENYQLTRNEDGSVTVEQLNLTAIIDPLTGRNLVSDGIDRLANMERVRFANNEEFSLATLLNRPATGSPVLSDATPTEGDVISASIAAIADADGLPATFNYQWQSLVAGTWTDIAGASNANFTPTQAQVGLSLRVVVAFTDQFGTSEVVMSEPTAVVGDLFNGGAAADTFTGTDGADRAFGNGQADILAGGLGNDELSGGAGNDTLTGGAGDDLLDGGAGGGDTAVFSGLVTNYNFALALDGRIQVADHTGADGVDSLTLVENVSFAGDQYVVRAGTATNNTIAGNATNEIVLGFDGQDTLSGGGGTDVIGGGGGDDAINGNGGDDTILWRVGDGRDFINGGAGIDVVHIAGSVSAEAYDIYSRVEANLAGIAINNAATEIVITRNGVVVAELDNIEEIEINGLGGGDTYNVHGTFNNTSLLTSTITINGGSGNDSIDITDLQSAHRIVFRSNGGNDTVIGDLRPQDVVELAPGQDISTYTLVDNGNGTRTFTNSTHSITFTGAVPPQFANDSTPDDDAIDGAFEYSPSDIAGLEALVRGQQPANGDDDGGPVGPRQLSGHGNNAANPNWGSADQAFIRLTEARYGEPDEFGNRKINPVFEGLDPREISNILGTQEAGLPDAGNDANIFFMAMGQYIDHGLDFLPKGGNGTIQIGQPGGGNPAAADPADLSRGTVYSIDANGIPQHKNQTSPFVDQNQAYGSHNLVGQFLRESDGNQGLGMRLLAGAPDPSNPEFKLLPTLRELLQHHWQANTIFHDPGLPGGAISFREYYTNYAVAQGVTGTLFDPGTGAYDPQVLSKLVSDFMGSTHPLILDANPFVNMLDHYVAGDGRANENFALTSIHTIWSRNHNHHVEGLLEAGFQGTPEEVFQAAKMINEAEYQRVVFDEYLDTLLGGLRSEGTHGFEEYDPNTNPAISHEFAAAVFRFGHSLIGQTMTVLDADGEPMQVNLFDAFLNPSNDPGVFAAPLPPGYQPQPGYAQHGVSAIVAGTVTQAAEDVDFNLVDAIRNDLVRIRADLFAFNVARSWDVGLGTLNQVRSDLAQSASPYVTEAVGFAGGDLSPYASWEDFQARNGLSNAVIAQFKQAYPDLVLAAADIAAFQAINPDIDIAMQSGGTGVVKGIDRLDLWVGGLAEKHINGGIVGQTFWVVLHEQFERLQDADRFYYIERFDNFDFYENFIDGQEFADIIARNTGIEGLPEHMFRVDDEDDAGVDNDDDEVSGDEDDDEEQPSGEDDDQPSDDEDDDDEDSDDDEPSGEDDDDDVPSDDEDDDDDQPSDDDDDDQSSDDEDDDEEDDETSGEDDDDDVPSDDDDDGPSPSVPASVIIGTVAGEVLLGTAQADTILALGGDDNVLGGAGDDVMRGDAGDDFLSGEDGRDIVYGGGGRDDILGGDGADMLYGDAGNDRLFGGAGTDLIDGGAGKDEVNGGEGDDVFVASAGNDVYWGEAGADTLDMARITSGATVDLGTGFMGRGSASSAELGADTLWGVENVVTGSGADTITASAAVNIMDGGAGSDTFRFLAAADADGDTIVGFQPGDRLDLSGVDADAGQGGNQAFTLVTGSGFTGPGQLLVSQEVREDGEYTVVAGNTAANAEPEFRLSIKGVHELTNSDFNL